MKLILENWRQYLLNEGMVTLDTMPEDYSIEIFEDEFPDTPYSVRLIQRPNDHPGAYWERGSLNVVNIDPNDLWDADSPGRQAMEEYYGEEIDDIVDECLDDQFTDYEALYTLHVQVDDDTKGYGPLLTDLAMELAFTDKKRIISANMVGQGASEAFKRVMKYYLHNRNDVTKIKINPECWEYYTGQDIDKYAEEFTHLYSKSPTILNSPLAKTKIIWKK